jgi:hypothetical protein
VVEDVVMVDRWLTEVAEEIREEEEEEIIWVETCEEVEDYPIWLDNKLRLTV